MNIEDFEIDDRTIATVKESKIQLKELLDCGEFSKEDYYDQMEQLNQFNDDLICCWASRLTYSHKFLDDAGLLYYEKDTENIVDFIGYC